MLSLTGSLSQAMFFNDVCPVIHPLVIQEALVSRFRYWNETVQDGMYCSNDLYTHFQYFSVAHRLNAYAVAYEQIEQGNTVCITVSETRYTIWLCLRTHESTPSGRGTADIAPKARDDSSEEEVCLSI